MRKLLTTILLSLLILSGIPVFAAPPATVTYQGYLTTSGGAAISSSGVCWSTTSTPTISNSKTTNLRFKVRSPTPFQAKEHRPGTM